MSILFADNFKTYGTSTTIMRDGIWAEIGGITGTTVLTEDPDPNVTGNVLFNFGANGGQRARMVYPGSSKNVAGMSVRLWVNDLPSDSVRCTPYISFENNLGTYIIGVRLLPDGGLGVVTAGVSGSAPTILTSTNPVITANSWNHIEMKVTCGGAGAGGIEIRVNGLTVLNLTAQTWPSSSNVSSVVLGASSAANQSGVGGYWKDLVMWDTAGTQNNDFIGSCAVYTLIPDSDNTLNWNVSTGSTGFNLIDETNPVNDADYISADDTPPAASVFTVSDLPPDIVTVKALLPFVRAKKIDGGDGNVQLGLTGTLTDLGTDRPITTAFTYYWDVSELSPDTGVAYTPTEVNNIKLQVDRTI